jgi:hypothetical protein
LCSNFADVKSIFSFPHDTLKESKILLSKKSDSMAWSSRKSKKKPNHCQSKLKRPSAHTTSEYWEQTLTLGRKDPTLMWLPGERERQGGKKIKLNADEKGLELMKKGWN